MATRVTSTTPPASGRRSGASIEFSGLDPQHQVHWNYGPAELYEHAIRYEKDASIAENGALVVETEARFEPELPLAQRTSRKYGRTRVTVYGR